MCNKNFDVNKKLTKKVIVNFTNVFKFSSQIIID